MLNWLKKLFHKEQTSKKEKIISASVAFLYIFALGYRGNIVDGESRAFYEALIKPLATPPDWLLPFVWTAIFVLIGFAGYYVWNFYKSDRYRKIFAGLYFVNGLMVYAWPHVFFVKQNISTALYVVIGLIILAELMILSAFKTNHKAAYMLLPYLLWILFATYLNTSFILLNP